MLTSTPNFRELKKPGNSCTGLPVVVKMPWLMQIPRNLDAALTRNGMEHNFFVSGGKGSMAWANWRIYLNTFAPQLFK